jgi:hypothetical protein
MRRTLMFSIVVLLAVCVHADTPETVAVTYHVTPANEAALRTVIEKHFATGKRLSLLTHHQLYRGNGFFLEILTWRDESIPDNAPAEIRRCEGRWSAWSIGATEREG